MKIISASINVDLIKPDMLIKGKKGRYLPIVVTVFDQRDQYENDCSVTLEQTKEQRDAKAAKLYFGNGRVVWTDEKEQPKSEPEAPEENDLPF